MKTKFKLGQLVSFKEETGQKESRGVIDTIVVKTDGARYRVEDSLDEIRESQITQAYRPVGKVRRNKRKSDTQMKQAESQVQ